ncbi:MAG TPA: hypothetical protein VF857_09980 [Spirochaetota bacterium]
MSIFDRYESSVPQYDELFDRAGLALNEAASLYAQFVTEILRKMQCPVTLSEIELPIYGNGTFSVGHAVELLFDEYDRFPVVRFSEGMTIPFSDLSVVAADLISNHIFMEIKSADFFRSISADR